MTSKDASKDKVHDIVSIDINNAFCAEYERPEDCETLNKVGNFYRRKSIHNDVVRTIERLTSQGFGFALGQHIASDHFEITIKIVESQRALTKKNIQS